MVKNSYSTGVAYNQDLLRTIACKVPRSQNPVFSGQSKYYLLKFFVDESTARCVEPHNLCIPDTELPCQKVVFLVVRGLQTPRGGDALLDGLVGTLEVLEIALGLLHSIQLGMVALSSFDI